MQEQLDVICAECGARMVLRDSRFGKFYGCSKYPQCKGAHGAHPDGQPLGVPASAENKKARIRAHDAFDKLWKSRRMTRHQAYHFLQKLMGMSEAEAHIGRFSTEDCEKLLEALKREFL